MHKQGFTLIELLVATPRIPRGKSLDTARDKSHRNGFTLIELLVVVAILSVLAIVVVLTINPAGLLQESRDANRLSDMATLNSAIGYSLADNAAESLGSANTIYLSVPDATATSTAGDQCQGLGLLTLPVGYTYHCAASSTYRKTDGTGWIPVNLTTNTFGSPLAQLPVDPTNTTSSHLWYTYETDGSGKFEVTTPFESTKYKLGGSNDQIAKDGGTLASVYEKGSKLGMEPMDYGDSSMVGLWTFEEGSSSIAYDYSGNNATGSWNGTPTGTAGFYSAGKIGGWAGAFDGTSTYVNLSASPLATLTPSAFTISVWVNITTWSSAYPGIVDFNNAGSGTGLWGLYSERGTGIVVVVTNNAKWEISSSSIPAGWNQAVATWNGVSASMYLNGAAAGISYSDSSYRDGLLALIGRGNGSYFPGLIDDVRIYNRALSASEIGALYAGGK